MPRNLSRRPLSNAKFAIASDQNAGEKKLPLTHLGLLASRAAREFDHVLFFAASKKVEMMLSSGKSGFGVLRSARLLYKKNAI